MFKQFVFIGYKLTGLFLKPNGAGALVQAAIR